MRARSRRKTVSCPNRIDSLLKFPDAYFRTIDAQHILSTRVEGVGTFYQSANEKDGEVFGLITYGHFIGGQRVTGASSRVIDALEPMSGEVRSRVALASRNGVHAAVQNAVAMVGVPASFSDVSQHGADSFLTETKTLPRVGFRASRKALNSSFGQ